ncbi:MAG: polysaccharide deacetylase family protein [Planctomycetota bacterium]
MIRFDKAQSPMPCVVVDTEEEFDWALPKDPNSTGVSAIAHATRFQELCDEFGIVPTYVVTYPVASQPEGYGPLKEVADAGRALIGAHPHAWTTPPHDEEVSARNSYAGNLDADLERSKLRCLTDEIERNFGTRPTMHKAGRYGLGPNTFGILRDEGYEIDLSVCPGFDSSDDGGPDFTHFRSDPYWVDGLFELPLTADLVGYLQGLGPGLFAAIQRPPLSNLRTRGILSRLGALDRLRLTPEGGTTDHHFALTRSLVRRGGRAFSWTFHSPSLKAGCTPYVEDEAELEEFLACTRRYFEFFMGKTINGVPATPYSIRDAVA